jgi:hypothetical protein
MPRPTRFLLPALALPAALALASCGGGSATTTVERTVTVMKTREAPATLLPDVLGQNHVEPRTYSFSADGDLVVVNLKWQNWGRSRARARGRIEERPASGLTDSFAGSVEAFAPVNCHGRRYYTEVFAKVPPQAPFVPEGPTKLDTPCD